MKSWKAELALLFMTFVWGGTFIFTKIGLNFASPSLYVIIRFSIALTLCLIFFGKYLKKLERQTFYNGMVLGLLFGGGFLLQTLGLKLTTVPKSAFITGITVVITPFAYWFIEKKKISLWQKIGVVIAAFGLWLFTNPQFDNLNIGDVLTFFSTLFWAFYITYMDVFTRGKNSKEETGQLVILQFVMAAPIALTYFLLFERTDFTLIFSNQLLISLAYNGILASFLLTIIHTTVQRYTTPVKAALIFSLEPVLASLFAMLFIAEIIIFREYTGGAILMFGVLIS
ncbi:MAG: DMT family transporter, partial [Bacteroidota bacterium]